MRYNHHCRLLPIALCVGRVRLAAILNNKKSETWREQINDKGDEGTEKDRDVYLLHLSQPHPVPIGSVLLSQTQQKK